MKKLIGLMVMLAVLAIGAQATFAAAATAAVNTPSRSGMKSNYSVYTNTIIYAGTIVCLNSTGYAVPAADTASYIVVGRASKTVDNRDGNATGFSYSGNLKIDVERGVFGWTGLGISDDTAIGSICYVSNDNAVTNGAGSNAIIAGVVVDYSDGLVWVDTFNIGRTAGSYTTLATSGATTLGAAATVTGLLRANGGFNTDGGVFSVADTSGNTKSDGTLAIAGAATFGTTVTATGQVTFVVAPKFSAALATPGAVVANTLVNLPTSSITNAVFFTFVNGTNTYAVPAYLQP